MGFLSNLFGVSHHGNGGETTIGGGRANPGGSFAESLGLANQFTGQVEVKGQTLHFVSGQVVSAGEAASAAANCCAGQAGYDGAGY